MFLIGIGLGCIAGSIILFLLTYIFPILRLVYFDWIALIVMIVPYAVVLFKIKQTHCWKQVDNIPKWKHLIKYLRRDNETIEVLGERAYPGESFVDVPQLGLIEYLGNECYYNSGNKKYAWVLENMNFTPDPRYSNLTHILWNLGFSNSEEVKKVLMGGLPDLRDKVYSNMVLWENSHGAKKLTSDMQGYDGKPVSFRPNLISPRRNRHQDAVEMIDNKLRRRDYRDGGGGQVW